MTIHVAKRVQTLQYLEVYKTTENHIVGTALALNRPVLIDRGLNGSILGRQRWISYLEAVAMTIHVAKRVQTLQYLEVWPALWTFPVRLSFSPSTEKMFMRTGDSNMIPGGTTSLTGEWSLPNIAAPTLSQPWKRALAQFTVSPLRRFKKVELSSRRLNGQLH